MGSWWPAFRKARTAPARHSAPHLRVANIRPCAHSQKNDIAASCVILVSMRAESNTPSPGQKHVSAGRRSFLRSLLSGLNSPASAGQGAKPRLISEMTSRGFTPRYAAFPSECVQTVASDGLASPVADLIDARNCTAQPPPRVSRRGCRSRTLRESSGVARRRCRSYATRARLRTLPLAGGVRVDPCQSSSTTAVMQHNHNRHQGCEIAAPTRPSAKSKGRV